MPKITVHGGPSDANAEALAEEATAPAATDTTEGDAPGRDPYTELTYAELQAEAKDRAINAKGSREDLEARLREDDQSRPKAEEDETVSDREA
jgi:hypothetical protein